MRATITPATLAASLEQQRTAQSCTRGELVRAAGLSYQSLQKILEGRSDFRVSSLLALAHALGLEVALVPAAVGAALPAGTGALPAAPDAGPSSAVAAALARLRPPAAVGPAASLPRPRKARP